MTTIFKYATNPFDTVYPLEKWEKKAFEFSLMDQKSIKKTKAIFLLASHYYFSCFDVKRYENVIKFFFMITIVDDHVDCKWGDVARNGVNAQEIMSQLGAISDRILNKDKFTSISNWKPYVVYFYAIFENISQDLNAVSKRRLLSKFDDYIQFNIEESKKVEQGYVFKDFDEIFYTVSL